jgi:hypothetical protein
VQSLLDSRAYFPVRRVPAEIAIGPAFEQIFRRDYIHIVNRLANLHAGGKPVSLLLDQSLGVCCDDSGSRFC